METDAHPPGRDGDPAGPAGTELTGIEVEAEIGRSPYTTVHRVRHGAHRLALKRPRTATLADEPVLASFRREAALLACVDHPGVVRAHAAGRYDGSPALLTELIDGRQLAAELVDGALPLDRVATLARELAEALVAAHRAGLVHRDIKPQNIMVPPGRPAVLIDFGLAALGQDRSTWEAAVGTFAYSAPEQSGMLKRPVDARSDLYALGAVLFECLTGRPPYLAGDGGELLRQHAVAPVPDPRDLRSDLDPAFAAVVTRLLAKDPDDRYPSAAALLAALDDIAGAEWPLCGRAAERRGLLAGWEEARGGRGGFAVVRGPAGGGRSRLAAEVAAAAIADGSALVLRTRAVKDEALPLAAVRAAIEAHLNRVRELPDERRAEAYERLRRAADTAGAALVADLSPALTAILADRPGPPADGRDDRLFSALAVFLTELARRYGSAVLEVDDAQWLDAASRRVLDLLAADLPAAPLLVVLTCLDEAGAVPVATGDAPVTEVSTGPLDLTGTAALVASRLPGATVTPDLVAHVAARTGGLPLASVEYLRQLVDAGLLTPMWGTWRLDESGLDRLRLSRDVGDLIVSRLDGLPADARELLVAAAAVGNHFRLDVVTAVCALPDERLVAALDAVVARRLVEPRGDGRYGFIHPDLRDALLAGVSAERLRRLHAAVAESLDRLPAPVRDAGHVYALARHHAQAGTDADPSARYASALAAGRQALADQVPADAVDFLEQARALAGPAGRPVDSTQLHPLALAYLRAGRFADALSTLEEALAGERDPQRRAELYRTLVELHHTTWADDRATDAARRGLAELGHGLPRNRLVLVVTTLALGLAGALAARFRRFGLATVRGRRREELAAVAALLGSGAYAAAIGLRPKEVAIFALRGLYAVNRLGPCPPYVQVYGLLGYLAALLKRRRVAEGAFARAARAAQTLGDPAMVAYADWVRGIALYFGGLDDGSGWDGTLARQNRWLEPAQFITGLATAGTRLVLRGYTREAQAAYEQGLRHLPNPEQASGTSFAMLGVMIPAQRGRHVEAAAALAALRASFLDGSGSPVQRANIVTAAACAAVEQGEFGAPFDALLAEFEGLGLRRGDLMPQHDWFYVYRAHGRLAQLRVAPEHERPGRLAVAEQAVRELRRYTATPLLKVAYGIACAALEQQRGNAQKAVELTDRMERAARPLDAPLVSFEAARIRARALRQLGLTAEAERQARSAYLLAAGYGWEHRRRQVRVEFGVDDAPSVARFTHAATATTGVNRRLEALQQVSAAAASILDPRRLAGVALDETLGILGAERALMFVVDDAGEPVPFAGRDAAGNDVDAASGYGSTLVRRVLETGEALVVTGTDEGAALGSQSVVAHGLRSIMVAPVQLKGAVRGVVYLDSRVARGVFTEDDVAVLTAITHHVAVSLETARAAQLDVEVRTSRRQQELAETLRASLVELSAILDPAELLNTLFTTLYHQSGARAGCLLRGSGPQLTAVAVAGAVEAAGPGAEVDLTWHPSLTALWTATAPTIVAGDVLPPTLRAAVGRHPVALVVPLIAREAAVGLVVLAGAAFDDSGRAVCAGLASQGMSAYDNAVLFSRVQELATTDDLTGVPNRRHFYALAGALVSAARRNGRVLGAVMLDIDNFKTINDTYGHAAGDDVIREVARRIRAAVRVCDVLGRYGGEEFAAVLPDLDDDVDLAERVRTAVAASPVPTRTGPIPVTVSVGVARLAPVDDDLDQLLARADHALYRAKQAGRNRVEEA